MVQEEKTEKLVFGGVQESERSGEAVGWGGDG